MNDWQKMYDKLNAVPPGKRRLAKGVVWDKRADCGCVLGTLVGKEAWPPQGMSFTATLERIATGRAREGAQEALDEFGLVSRSRIESIEIANDEFGGSREARFEHMLAWLKTKAEKAERSARALAIDTQETPS